jgi:multidrug efflux pump subunit AcrA (membrane-fusion protein)
MWLLRMKTVWWAGSTGTLVIVGLVVVVLAAAGPGSQSGSGTAQGASPLQNEDGGLDALSVKTIRAKRDPSFTLSVQEPATVAAYYLSELNAQVAGNIEMIHKARGSQVQAGELLAKIAVPDLDQEVALKEAVVKQRREEWEVARKNVEIARAAKMVAENNIEVEKAGEDEAKAMENYRGKLYRRLQRLVEGPVPGATGQIAEEAELAYLAALAGVRRAKNAAIKAESALTEAQAKLDAANADVKLKAALIGVAEKDKQKAQALAAYSEIRWQFDGEVKRRFVDPGSFLRIGEPILAVERTDIVTISMKVPDTFAPYVAQDTDALIMMSELPGQVIHGKVTRFSPSLLTETNDHTMLVEVDLYNRGKDEYQKFLDQENAKKAPKKPFDDLKEGPLPIIPEVTGSNIAGEPHRLLPGMYGEMRLVFRKLPNDYLIPSDAIDRSGGTPSLFLVKDGKAVRVKVAVEVDDQKLAKVRIIERNAKGEEIKRPLNGTENIIYSNFNELTEGEPVNAIPVDWTPRG